MEVWGQESVSTGETLKEVCVLKEAQAKRWSQAGSGNSYFEPTS